MKRPWLAPVLLVAPALTAQTGKPMHISGPFDVKVSPEEVALPNAKHGRLALDKHFHGDLEASSVGEMLSGGDPASGVGGYVAIETVSGKLSGKTGTFQLMHWGTMEGGKFELKVEVVPGSGTGELKGITGMKIEIAAGGKHTYVFDYVLPDAK